MNVIGKMYRTRLVAKMTLQNKIGKFEDRAARSIQHETEKLKQAKTMNRKEKFQTINYV